MAFPNPLNGPDVADWFNQLLSGTPFGGQPQIGSGSLTPDQGFTYGGATDPGAANATPPSGVLVTQQTQAASILAKAGIATGDSLLSQDQILDVFHAQGVD